MPDLMTSDVDPAVQAAAEAIGRWREEDIPEQWTPLGEDYQEATEAVAAARPLIARQAAAEALRDAADEWAKALETGMTLPVDGAYVARALLSRAEEIEANRG